MGIRWIEWFWRNKDSPRLGSCRWCSQSLTHCPTCGGEWETRACCECQLGLVCPQHRSYWI